MHPQTTIRFRRPILVENQFSEIIDSYETLTLSELQQLDAQRDLDVQARLEEIHLALDDFDGTDEFEEVDEFEDEWDEDVGVEADWDVDVDGYCEAGDCGEEFLDDTF
jgi:hypothetical protein